MKDRKGLLTTAKRHVLEEEFFSIPPLMHSEPISESASAKDRCESVNGELTAIDCNVLPTPSTRVVLQNTGEKASDYINANFVEGAERRFIATQGPMRHTSGDFWWDKPL